MKNNNNIFELFRDNQHKLNEMPSRQSWQRLEQRLDKHRRRNRTSTLRYVLLAASVLLVFAVLATISTSLQKERSGLASYSTGNLEALPAATEDSSAYKVVEYQRQYTDRTPQIAEGGAGRKILASTNQFYDEKTKVVKSETVNKLVEELLAPRTYHRVPATSDFKWLVGDWKGNTAQGFSYEKWTQTGDTELSGEGWLVVNGERKFIEKMRLKRQNDNWFFDLQLDAYANPISYKLTSFSEEGVVFENPNYNFPNKVVLKRYATGEFSWILIPKSTIQLSPAQLHFLQQRNVILVDKAVRNLWRTIPDITKEQKEE